MKAILFCLLFLLSLQLFAVEDSYKFNSLEQQRKFNFLITQFRCLVCQNQNLAESNSALASDLRDEIYKKIQAGETELQVKNYLVARYGNFILYSPPLNLYTVGLWFGPLFFLIFSFVYLIVYIHTQKRD